MNTVGKTSVEERDRFRIELDVDHCSVGRGRGVNEDYVLFREGIGACVSDGVGGAPLGDAVARIACHTAMHALERGESASSALAAAQNRILTFIADVDSPGSGASLAVVALDGGSMDAAWAGDTAILAMRRQEGGNVLISSLDRNRFPAIPPLGRGNGGNIGSLSERIEDIDSIAICTDGAWRTTSIQNIAMLLGEGDTARRTAAKIVLGRQSHDDSTALVAKVRLYEQRRS